MNQKHIYKKLAFLWIALMLVTSIPAFSQKKDYKEIKIGDTIPPLMLKGFPGLHDKAINLRAEAGKGLLILNFWATWCVPCIREMPVLDSIVAKHPKNVTIYSIAYEDSIVIKRFFKKNTEFKWPHLQIATNDNQIRYFFPHKMVPHNIWIDRKGVVRAITDSEDMTIGNVEKFLSGSTPKVKVKKDNITFDYTKPFHLADSSYLYRSQLSPYIDGIGGGIVPWGANGKGMSRYLAFNISMLDIFVDAYSQHTAFYNKDFRRMRIITNDSARFFRPKQIHNKALTAKYVNAIDWEKENGYCYDLTLPGLIPDSLFYNYVIADLERYFHVKYRLEDKKMLCKVVRLKKNSPFRNVNFRSKSDSVTYQEIYKGRIVLRNTTFKEFMIKTLSVLKDQDDPWIDETGLHYPLDITIDLDKGKEYTVENITAKLAEYGVEVKQEYRQYPIMVLEDLNK